MGNIIGRSETLRPGEGVNIFPGPNGVIETTPTGPEEYHSSDDTQLEYYKTGKYLLKLEEVNAIKNKRKQARAMKEFQDDDYFKEINQFIAFTNLIEDGGTLILGGCIAADGSYGTTFLKNLNAIVKGRIKIVANQDFTRDNGYIPKEVDGKIEYIPAFFDVGRTGNDNYSEGWKIIGKDGNPSNSGGDLRLKGKGNEMYDFEYKIDDGK